MVCLVLRLTRPATPSIHKLSSWVVMVELCPAARRPTAQMYRAADSKESPWIALEGGGVVRMHGPAPFSPRLAGWSPSSPTPALPLACLLLVNVLATVRLSLEKDRRVITWRLLLAQRCLNCGHRAMGRRCEAHTQYWKIRPPSLDQGLKTGGPQSESSQTYFAWPTKFFFNVVLTTFTMIYKPGFSYSLMVRAGITTEHNWLAVTQANPQACLPYLGPTSHSPVDLVGPEDNV